MTSIGVRQGYSQLVQAGYGQEAKKKPAKKTEEQTRTVVEQEGVSYEKTIPDSVSAGLGFIKEMEQQNEGTKFHIGTVSYGQTYGDSSSVNFVVNPKFLEKLGSDAEARKQFEEDVKYLNFFSKRFKEQQASSGREVVSQGWFCDENGNWGGWTISRKTDRRSVLQDMADRAEEIRMEKLEERREKKLAELAKEAELKCREHFSERFKGIHITQQEAAEPEESERTVSEKEDETEKIRNSEEEGSKISGRVGVNAGKLARKIAAAKTVEQLRAVMAEIQGDMQEVKAGLAKGMCDESEVKKVEALMTMAKNRMGEVEDREATPEEESMFAMASLL